MERTDLFDRLGPAVAREHAGKRALVPRTLRLGSDAVEALAGDLRSLSNGTAVVLFDSRTREVAGASVIRALSAAQFRVHEALVPDAGRQTPVCDDATLQGLRRSLVQPDLVVGVGAGVISDLAKWLAFEAGVPGAVFATAASMNGYAAANVAPAIDGVKSLVHARAHRVVAADPEILSAAPERLTSAGLGDMIAKSVSTADWRLNHLLFGENFSEATASILDDVEARYLDAPHRLAVGEPNAVAALFEGLVFSGCAMTLHGSSLPASGGEHLISHALDMRAEADGAEHDLHGRQVGVATIFVAALYERILALESPRFDGRALDFDRAGWGRLAGAVRPHYDRQSVRLSLAAERLSEKSVWDSARVAVSAEVPSPGWVQDKLSAARAAHTVSELDIDPERFLWAVLNGAQMRERLTSLDLAWITGVLPGAAREILDEWLV